MENNSQRKRIVLGVMLIAVVVVTLAGTFAYFVSNTQSTEEKLTVTTGTLALTFSDNNTGITKNKLQLGESTTKEFKIENTGTEEVTTNMLWNNLINTYTEGSLTYKFEYSTNETGPWTAVPNASGDIPQSESASDKNLATNLTIPAHTTYYYQLTITFNDLPDVNQTVDKTAVLSSNFKLGDKILTLSEKTLVKLDVIVKTGSPNFGTNATTDEGLFSLPDDYGTSYYYRGAVENNYVKFAGKFWRIIRINGDGSLRMIYDGTVAHKNGGGVETFTTTGVNGSTSGKDRFINNGSGVAFNSSRNDNAYVGWMYGSTSAGNYTDTHKNIINSNIKNVVNKWYDNNLASYDEYIADAVYCADRSIPEKETIEWENNTGLGYGTNATSYENHVLVYGVASHKNKLTSFKCSQKNDAFTVSDNIYGNAIGTAKSRKIGLITIPEIMAAGGSLDANYYYYLYKTSDYWYWGLSPAYTNIGGLASVFGVKVNGAFRNDGYVDNTGGAVAPVISIKAEYATQLTGEGTADDPYTISGVA